MATAAIQERGASLVMGCSRILQKCGHIHSTRQTMPVVILNGQWLKHVETNSANTGHCHEFLKVYHPMRNDGINTHTHQEKHYLNHQPVHYNAIHYISSTLTLHLTYPDFWVHSMSFPFKKLPALENQDGFQSKSSPFTIFQSSISPSFTYWC